MSYSVVRALAQASQRNTSNTPAQTTVNSTAGQILAANDGRKGLIIVNTGTTTVKLSLGATSPTQTVYHVPLKACAAADDGSGGAYTEDAWTGAVQAISSVDGGTIVILEIA